MNPYLEALNLAITYLEDIVYLELGEGIKNREEAKNRIERLKSMRDRAKSKVDEV